MAEDLDLFDISFLDEHLHPANGGGQTSNENTKAFVGFEILEDVIVNNQDAHLSSSNWMSTFVNLSENDSNERTDFDAESAYSDTESQAGGSSAVPSPAPNLVSLNKSFGFLPLDDKELTKISVKELNRLLKNKPKQEVERIKRRRRTLKNRRYAHSCRMKRLHEKSTLETTKEDMEKTIFELRQKLESACNERDGYKARSNHLVLQLQIYKQNYSKHLV